MACPKHAPQTGENRPRRWNAAGFLPFRLEVLTPVFVGTGEELSPLDYVIRKEGREHVLYLADCAGWLQAHAADPAIGAALAEGDMLGLRRLLTEQLDEKLYGLARLPFTLPATALELQKQHYRSPQQQQGRNSPPAAQLRQRLRLPARLLPQGGAAHAAD